MSSGVADLDFIEELRLRRWARENYVPADSRQSSWHAVVLEEMKKKEQEFEKSRGGSSYRWDN